MSRFPRLSLNQAEEVCPMGESEKILDDPYALYFARPISRRISRRLQGSGVTPNQVSILSLFAGISSIVLVKNNLLGALLIYLSFLLDCVDGELARLKKEFTLSGIWLESVFDRLPDVLPILAMGYSTERWDLAALSVTGYFLIRTIASTNLLISIELGLKGEERRKGIFPHGKYRWLRYTKSLHLLILTVFVFLGEYLMYLKIFSAMSLIYFLFSSLLGLFLLRKFEDSTRQSRL